MFNAKAFKSAKSAFSELSKCKNFLFISGLILLGQWLITSLGGEMFRVKALDTLSWVLIIVSTSVVLWGGEFIRLIRRK